jgi:hypothetical protein
MDIDYPDTEVCTDAQIEEINKREFPQEMCSHEFVSKEYTSQPYGTCVCCGKFIQN